MRCFCATALLLAAAVAPAFAGSKSEIAWRNKSELAWEEARLKGRPILMEVWADWCGPCRRMDREVWSDPRIIAISRKFECVSVDVSRQSLPIVGDLIFGTHGRYEVRALPTVMIMDPWREVLLFSDGLMFPKELLAILREIPGNYNGIRTWRQSLEVRRDNARALARVGELYDRSTAYGIANRYYREALRANGAKEDDSLREDLMFGIAMNEIRRADWSAARKALENFRAGFPASRRSDQVLLGLVLADVRQARLAAAEQWFALLRSSYPASDAVATAARLIAGARPAEAR